MSPSELLLIVMPTARKANAMPPAATICDMNAASVLVRWIQVSSPVAEPGNAGTLIRVADAALGRIRGGLGQVNVGASMFFAEISGSAVADVAAIMLHGQVQYRGDPTEVGAALEAAYLGGTVA